MCGRYSLDLNKSKTSFKKDTLDKFDKIFSFKNLDISPSSLSPVISFNNNEYVFDLFKWGFDFDWLPKGKVLFNVRSETVADKSFSKDLLARNRCLVPFNFYFEWQNIGKIKQKFKIFTSNDVSYFAGIYLKSTTDSQFSILTKSSASNIEHIHQRNPIIVNNNKIRKWFSSDYKDVLNSEFVDFNFEEI